MMEEFEYAGTELLQKRRHELRGYRVYLERYVSKTFNKLDKYTFALGLFSQEGMLVELYPKERDAIDSLFHGEIRVGDLWGGLGEHAISRGLHIRRSCRSVGEENEASILKKYAIYFSIMNMNDIYEPYALQPPCGIAIITSTANASDLFFSMVVGIAHDLMVNMQFKNISIKFYERSGKGLLVVDSMLAETMVITYYNEELFQILGIPSRDISYQPVEAFLAPLPQNQDFWDIIFNYKMVTNFPIRLRVENHEVECLVSTDVYKQPSIKSAGVIFYLTTQQKLNEEVSRRVANGAVKTFDDIIGRDTSLRAVVERARRMALTDSNVMILGESGTGKDVLAQAIHNGSNRSKKPFIALNCGAMPKDLIESELFGYEAGAFTGAKRNGNMGKFELAMGGTIFLDEIGEMPLDLQAKLLRVVENKQIMRLGGNRLIDVDVKIIAATNVDILDMIEKKKFRADLFYRLSTMRLYLMPLRERKQDIVLLSEYFIKKISERTGKEYAMRLSDEAKELLCSMNWPGNVRELQNVIECIVQLYPGDLILPWHVLENVAGYQRQEGLCAGQPEYRSQPKAAVSPTLPPVSKPSGVTREQLLEALSACGNNRTEAAKYLNISRRSLYRKMDEFGLSSQ